MLVLTLYFCTFAIICIKKKMHPRACIMTLGGGSITIKAIKLSGTRLYEEVTHPRYRKEIEMISTVSQENLCKRSTAFGLMKWKS